jgi:putative transposase
MNDQEFEALCLELNWSREASELATRIRTSEPVRLVRGGRGNVRGRYPSKKMGRTIQFESHTCELAFILGLEYHQADVLEYWDQPTTFKLEYKNTNGRSVGPLHTPDFFVIRTTHAEFVECKTEEELIKLANKQPGRYYLDKDGRWHCPPGEEFAAQFGFKYVVVSTAEIDRTHIRNTVFLEDYLDKHAPPVAAESREIIVSAVALDPGVTLDELLRRMLEAGSVTADDIYKLLADGTIFVDLRAEALVERDRVRVYPDAEHARQAAGPSLRVTEPKGKVVEIKEGARILLDNAVMSIVCVGESKIYLEGEKGTAPCLTFSHFEDLVRRGEIQGVATDPDSDPDSVWKRMLNSADEKRLAEAKRRLRLVHSHDEKRPLPEHVPPRTLARWKARARAGLRIYGNELAGLLPDWHKRGDRKTERLHPDARKHMLEAIKSEYETLVQKGMFVVYSEVMRRCDEMKIKEPSYVTFVRYVKRRPRYLQTLKRMGHRAAYALKPFYYWLDPDTPRHGDRPFEICHIDHTQLDIELVDPKTGENFGRPWATFMVDAFSRRIVAIYLTFDPPSYRSNMMVLRECVRRTGRLPQIIVVDGGGDFHSEYFETLAAAFVITIKTRPGNQPKFGSVIERLFNTVNKQFVHNLIGNTQITRNVRLMTKANDPKRLAVWSLAPFYDALCDWAYNWYDQEEHSTLKQSPREAYAAALRLTGLRRHRLIAYDEEFQILTLPSTPKGTAKNATYRGVKIKNHYYTCPELGAPDVEGVRLPVRYDPFNRALAYVFVAGRWVNCWADDRYELEGRTEREQKVMSAEQRMRDRLYARGLSKRALARALKHQSDMAMQKGQDEELRRLRRKEAQNSLVRAVIDGSAPGRDASAQPEDNTVASKASTDEVQDSSLFAKIDLNGLGALEVYEG